MKRIAHILGLDETRCLACQAPFVPKSKALPPLAAMVEDSLCPVCRSLFILAGKNVCPHCGLPATPSRLSGPLCGACMQSPPPWGEFYFIGPYDGLLSDMILKLKFGADFAAGNFLGSMLATVLAGRAGTYDLLMPMPIHPSRLLQRGYNQCRELARPVAAGLKIKVDSNTLRRKKATAPQAGLNAAERRANVKDAFHCAPLKGENVLLLDDILTTGATMRYAVEALLRAGASSVAVAVVARTPLDH